MLHSGQWAVSNRLHAALLPFRRIVARLFVGLQLARVDLWQRCQAV